MAAYITVGAKTDHGGTVITGSALTLVNGIPVARKGDKVQCQKCKKVVTIVTGDPAFVIDGAPVARAGDMTSCGSKLIAIQQAFAESDFDVGGIEPPAPLQFPKSEASNSFVDNNESYNDKFQLLDKVTQRPLSHVKYRLDYDNKSIEGQTDVEGFTETIEASYSAEVIIYLLIDEE